ncbi:hypothetical protein ACMFMG_010770 [Clarireedia jacksonii]
MASEKRSVDGAGQHKSEPKVEASEADKPTPSEESLDVEAQKENSGSAQVTEESPPTPQITYILGWKLHLLTLAICICGFVTNVEVSIVSTSLVTISDDFHSFKDNIWIVSAYQVTYTAFLVIWAKLSDIFGRKKTLIIGLIIFIAFSAGCGGAQSMTQLLVCRAFQGLGASGTFAVPTVVFYEMIPRAKYPLYSALIFANVILATVVGPLLGGAVDNDSTWRWIFLIQIPLGVIALAIIVLILPMKFPYHGSTLATAATPPNSLRSSLKKIDYVGAILLLAATFVIVTPFLEVSIDYAWSSATVIVLLVFGGVLWPLFLSWEWFISRTKRLGHLEPFFPFHFVHNRLYMGVVITSILMGIPATIISFEIPQRYQVANALTPLGAGIRLLSFVCAQPLGSFMANAIAGATKMPPLFILLAGTALQILGLGLMTRLPSSGTIPGEQYAYQAIMGWGCGLTFSIVMLITPFTVGAKDLVQFRLTGQAIGLAIATGVLNSDLSSKLSTLLTTSQLQALLRDISIVDTFPQNLQESVGEIFGKAYNLNIKVMIGFAVAQFLAAGLLWRRPQLSIKHKAS